MNTSVLITLAISLAVLMPSIVFHEVAHGFAALALGDETAKIHRRLTLNPLKHIDPFGTVLMPLLLLAFSGGRFAFGYAKPVPVNPHNFRRDVDRRWGMFLVSMAGPGTNLALAIAGSLVFRVMLVMGAPVNPDGTALGWIAYAFEAFIQLNLVLMFFNLIPIPPLDGSRILPLILPAPARPFIYNLEKYGFPILFILLFLMPMLLGFSPLTFYLNVTVVPVFQLLTGVGVG